MKTASGERKSKHPLILITGASGYVGGRLVPRVGKNLIDSLRNETVVRNPAARATFPVHPLSVREAIARALQQEDRELAETR